MLYALLLLVVVVRYRVYNPAHSKQETLSLPCASQAIQAVEALLDTAGASSESASPRLNIKFVLEGQEEIMSPDLSPFLERSRQPDRAALLRADSVLSADGAQPSESRGGISLGLRGIVNAEVGVGLCITAVIPLLHCITPSQAGITSLSITNAHCTGAGGGG